MHSPSALCSFPDIRLWEIWRLVSQLIHCDGAKQETNTLALFCFAFLEVVFRFKVVKLETVHFTLNYAENIKEFR